MNLVHSRIDDHIHRSDMQWHMDSSRFIDHQTYLKVSIVKFILNTIIKDGICEAISVSIQR